MGPPSYMRSVVDRNVVIRRIPVIASTNIFTFSSQPFGSDAIQSGKQAANFGETHCLHNHVTSARKGYLFEYF